MTLAICLLFFINKIHYVGNGTQVKLGYNNNYSSAMKQAVGLQVHGFSDLSCTLLLTH